MASDFPLELLQKFLSLASSMGIVMQEDDTITQHARAFASDGFTMAKCPFLFSEIEGTLIWNKVLLKLLNGQGTLIWTKVLFKLFNGQGTIIWNNVLFKLLSGQGTLIWNKVLFKLFNGQGTIIWNKVLFKLLNGQETLIRNWLNGHGRDFCKLGKTNWS
ncbi:hypothetical protein AVEN_169599-1 [Araneus ventricosus]|uniref:Uncharacterized protein n=1 Tax=Araneus ventricosus TaxID=182803 RepID=A0A4Y2SAL2_ARAVE|nr:hypothetical protein AVEN_247114-1 [Araneus ventricosus]GBN84954.1 hypothetical protein AVEN_169599-1 [Araneus ventricosus]